MIEQHPDWQLVKKLQEFSIIYTDSEVGEVCEKAAKLIRELKAERNKLSVSLSRERFPDRTGQ